MTDLIYFQIYRSNGKAIELSKGGANIVIGRRSKTGSRLADLFVDDPYASRRHCRLYRDPDTDGPWFLEDMGSDNGTRLEGVPVTAPVQVKAGAWIQVGTTRLTFSNQPQLTQPTLDCLDSAPTMMASDVHNAPTMMASDVHNAPTMMASDVHNAPTMMASDVHNAPTMMASDVHNAPTMMAFDVRKTIPDALNAEGGTLVVASPDAQDTVTCSSTVNHHAYDDRSAEDNEAQIESVHVAPTVIGKTAAGMSDATERSRGSMIGGMADAISEDRRLQSILSESQIMHPWPKGVVASLCNLNPMKISIHSHLIQNMIAANYLDDVQTMALLEETQKKGQTFFRTLINSQSVRNILELILTNVSEAFDLEYIDNQEKLASQVMETEWLPFSRAKELGCVVLKQGATPIQGTIRYGVLDPFDVTLHDWVERCAQARPRCVLMHPEIFSIVIQSLRNKTSDRDDGIGISIDFTAHAETHLRDQIQNVDVPQMVNYFLFRAHIQGASDIHIEPTEEFILVRLRVDGILHQEISMPVLFHSEMASRLKILSGMDVVEKRRPQDGRLAVVIRNNPIDVRVSSYPTVFGEKFVLRLLDKNALRPSIETLGLMERDRRLLREKLAAPYGLVMISGPTGSGKTTTLYSCLGGMDRDKKNVLTVEDPVEYRMAGIHQMQVNHKIGLTFASGLRTILRQDPDVIMVGEIRDGETASMAVQASLTGHIVFSTIHTNDAVGVITRMLDMGIEPFLVSTALSLAVAQRLVRTLCKHCRISVSGQAILDQLQKEGVTLQRLQSLGIEIDPEMDYTQGSGCSHCRDTGYHGRRAVFEMFEMTDEARSLIMAGNINASKLKDLARQKGMTTLITHGVQLVEEEVTTFEEILRVLGEEN
ncbi:MAG: Flp pilus assembly complex ATPase component TadA [Magnetococcales bacterium]|nr:Flp pilus assembly complex ATPase component TadA [Magnetococcales bacterium]